MRSSLAGEIDFIRRVIFLEFHHYLKKGKSFSFGMGNQINSPDLTKELPQNAIERPFAGIVYFESGIQIRKNRWFYEAKLLGGLIGPKSRVDQAQTWFHNLFRLPPVFGWENQIEDAWLGNFSAKAIHSLVSAGPVEALLEGNSKFGNLEKSISVNPSVRLGNFLPLAFSQINGSRVGSDQNIECYVQFGANFKQVFFNRTLDGSSLNPQAIPAFSFNQSVNEFFGEFVWSHQHLGLSYGIYYRTKENIQATDQVYGRIKLSWLAK